jgi:hypothetical protein
MPVLCMEEILALSRNFLEGQFVKETICRECKSKNCVAAEIAHPVTAPSLDYLADVLTKAQTHKTFRTLVDGIKW